MEQSNYSTDEEETTIENEEEEEFEIEYSSESDEEPLPIVLPRLPSQSLSPSSSRTFLRSLSNPLLSTGLNMNQQSNLPLNSNSISTNNSSPVRYTSRFNNNSQQNNNKVNNNNNNNLINSQLIEITSSSAMDRTNSWDERMNRINKDSTQVMTQDAGQELNDEVYFSRQKRLARQNRPGSPSKTYQSRSDSITTSSDSFSSDTPLPPNPWADSRDSASSRSNILALAASSSNSTPGTSIASLASFMGGGAKPPGLHKIGTGPTEDEKEVTERLEREMEASKARWSGKNSGAGGMAGVSLASLMKGTSGAGGGEVGEGGVRFGAGKWKASEEVEQQNKDLSPIMFGTSSNELSQRPSSQSSFDELTPIVATSTTRLPPSHSKSQSSYRSVSPNKSAVSPTTSYSMSSPILAASPEIAESIPPPSTFSTKYSTPFSVQPAPPSRPTTPRSESPLPSTPTSTTIHSTAFSRTEPPPPTPPKNFSEKFKNTPAPLSISTASSILSTLTKKLSSSSLSPPPAKSPSRKGLEDEEDVPFHSPILAATTVIPSSPSRTSVRGGAIIPPLSPARGIESGRVFRGQGLGIAYPSEPNSPVTPNSTSSPNLLSTSPSLLNLDSSKLDENVTINRQPSPVSPPKSSSRYVINAPSPPPTSTTIPSTSTSFIPSSSTSTRKASVISIPTSQTSSNIPPRKFSVPTTIPTPRNNSITSNSSSSSIPISTTTANTGAQSLAAMFGSTATGPRLNKSNVEPSTEIEELDTEGPLHARIGNGIGGVALPGMVFNSSFTPGKVLASTTTNGGGGSSIKERSKSFASQGTLSTPSSSNTVNVETSEGIILEAKIVRRGSDRSTTPDPVRRLSSSLLNNGSSNSNTILSPTLTSNSTMGGTTTTTANSNSGSSDRYKSTSSFNRNNSTKPNLIVETGNNRNSPDKKKSVVDRWGRDEPNVGKGLGSPMRPDRSGSRPRSAFTEDLDLSTRSTLVSSSALLPPHSYLASPTKDSSSSVKPLVNQKSGNRTKHDPTEEVDGYKEVESPSKPRFNSARSVTPKTSPKKEKDDPLNRYQSTATTKPAFSTSSAPPRSPLSATAPSPSKPIPIPNATNPWASTTLRSTSKPISQSAPSTTTPIRNNRPTYISTTQRLAANGSKGPGSPSVRSAIAAWGSPAAGNIIVASAINTKESYGVRPTVSTPVTRRSSPDNSKSWDTRSISSMSSVYTTATTATDISTATITATTPTIKTGSPWKIAAVLGLAGSTSPPSPTVPLKNPSPRVSFSSITNTKRAADTSFSTSPKASKTPTLFAPPPPAKDIKPIRTVLEGDLLELVAPLPRRKPLYSAVKHLTTEVYSITPRGSDQIINFDSIFYESEWLFIVTKTQTNPDTETFRAYVWRGREMKLDEENDIICWKMIGMMQRQYECEEKEVIQLEQGYETCDLLEILGGTLIVRQGNRKDFEPIDARLYSVQACDDGIVIAETVMACENVCSAYCSVLALMGEVFVWIGRGSAGIERNAASTYAKKITDKREITVLQEGSETEHFWHILGGMTYASAHYWRFRPKVAYPTTLLTIDSNTEAILSRSTKLSTTHVSVIDAGFELWIIVPFKASKNKADLEVAVDTCKKLARSWKKRELLFRPAAHALFFPTALPRDLKHLSRRFEFEVLNTGSSAPRMNLFTLDEACSM